MEKINISHPLRYVLSKRIVASPSMTGVIVYGGQRLGKTSYALQVMNDIYQDWDVTLENTFFRLEDIIVYLRAAIKEDRLIPVLMWDDAGIHASKQLYFTKKNLTMYLQALMDVLGTVVKGLILTTPNPDSLLKSIRGYEFYRVKVTKANSGYDRIATGYRSILLPSGTRNISKDFKDMYNAIIPDNRAYSEYQKLRKSYLTDALDNLDAALDESMTYKEQIADQDIGV